MCISLFQSAFMLRTKISREALNNAILAYSEHEK